jgi:hypothetical protein
MPDAFLLKLCRVRCDLLEKAVADWRKNPSTIVRGDLDGALYECLNLPSALRRLHNAIFDRLDLEPLADWNAVGLAYQAIYDRILCVVEEIQIVTRDYGDKGRLIEDASTLPAVAAEVARMRRETFDSWPFFTQETLDEGRAEIARGEYVTAEELLHEPSRSHR